MRRDWMKKVLCGVAAILVLPTFAQAALILDFNGGNPSGTGPSQSGWDGFTLPGPGSYSGVTVAASVVGTAQLQGRDRGVNNPPNSGSFTLSNMYRDFLIADNSTANGGVSLLIGGLTPNAQYDGRIWSYDYGQRDNATPSLFRADWFANGNQIANDWSFAGWGLPANDTVASFTFSAVANGSGQITIQGLRDAGSTGNSVSINGLQLTLVPEPSSALLLVFGAVALVGRRFRRRQL